MGSTFFICARPHKFSRQPWECQVFIFYYQFSVIYNLISKYFKNSFLVPRCTCSPSVCVPNFKVNGFGEWIRHLDFSFCNCVKRWNKIKRQKAVTKLIWLLLLKYISTTEDGQHFHAWFNKVIQYVALLFFFLSIHIDVMHRIYESFLCFF